MGLVRPGRRCMPCAVGHREQTPPLPHPCNGQVETPFRFLTTEPSCIAAQSWRNRMVQAAGAAMAAGESAHWQSEFPRLAEELVCPAASPESCNRCTVNTCTKDRTAWSQAHTPVSCDEPIPPIRKRTAPIWIPDTDCVSAPSHGIPAPIASWETSAERGDCHNG